MSPVVFAPLVGTVVASSLATLMQRRLRPQHAVRILTATTAIAATAVLWSLLMLAVGWVVETQWVATHFGWCDVLPSHRHESPIVGAFAFAILGAAVFGAARVMGRRSRAAASSAEADGVRVLDLDEPIAHAVPGSRGHVVVSRGALDLLDERERVAMLAHERAHLDNHHHRYVGVAEVAAAAVPLLRPVARRVRFASERWADEEAARVVGDRRTVALAIIRVALARKDQAPHPVLALTGAGVQERVEALLTEPPAGWVTELALCLGLAAMLSAAVSSTVQLHHALVFAEHICPI